MIKPAAYIALGFVLAMLVQDSLANRPIFVEVVHVLEPPSFLQK